MQLPESEYCESSSRRGIDEVRYVSGLFKSPCTSPACQDEQGMSRTAISLRQVDSGVPGPPALFFLFESHLPGDRHSSLGECTRAPETRCVNQAVAHARHDANAGSFIRLASSRTCPHRVSGFPNSGEIAQISWRKTCGGGEKWNDPFNGSLGNVCALAPQELEKVHR